jgi:hypothetical protein
MEKARLFLTFLLRKKNEWQDGASIFGMWLVCLFKTSFELNVTASGEI